MTAKYKVYIKIYIEKKYEYPLEKLSHKIEISKQTWFDSHVQMLNIFEKLQHSWRVPQQHGIASSPATVRFNQNQYIYYANLIVDGKQVAHFNPDLSDKEQLEELKQEYLAYKQAGKLTKSITPVKIFKAGNQHYVDILPGKIEVLLPDYVAP